MRGDMPIHPDCPACENREPAVRECRCCGGRGRFTVAGRPSEFVTEDIWALMRAAALTRETGQWPRGGSYGDEPPGLIEMIRLIWRETDRIRCEQLEDAAERQRTFLEHP